LQLHDGTIVVGFTAGTIKRWSEDGARLVTNYRGHEDPVKSLIQIDRTSFMSGGGDRKIKLWSIDIEDKKSTTVSNNNTPIRTYVPFGEVEALARLWRNKKYGFEFASASRNESVIRLWSLLKTKCVKTLLGHSKHVFAMCELQNGYLVSASEDLTVKLWNIKISSEAVQTIKAAKCYSCYEGSVFQFRSGRLATRFKQDETGCCKVWTPISKNSPLFEETQPFASIGPFFRWGSSDIVIKLSGTTIATLGLDSPHVYHENGDLLWISKWVSGITKHQWINCGASLRGGRVGVAYSNGQVSVYKVQGDRSLSLSSLHQLLFLTFVCSQS